MEMVYFLMTVAGSVAISLVTIFGIWRFDKKANVNKKALTVTSVMLLLFGGVLVWFGIANDNVGDNFAAAVFFFVATHGAYLCFAVPFEKSGSGEEEGSEQT